MAANCGDLVCLHLEEAHWSGRRHRSPGRQHVQDDHGDGNDLGDFDDNADDDDHGTDDDQGHDCL